MRQLSVAVVGAAHPNSDGGNRRSELAFCEIGEALELRPEPKNPHDEHAIAVYSSRQFQIGYVASERAVFLKNILRGGQELFAIFQDVAPWGAIARIGVDAAPTLPPSARTSECSRDGESADLGEAFYPDYEPDYD